MSKTVNITINIRKHNRLKTTLKMRTQQIGTHNAKVKFLDAWNVSYLEYEEKNNLNKQTKM